MIINFKELLKRHKTLLVTLAFFIFLQLIISTIFPYITKLIIDNVLVKQQLSQLAWIVGLTILLVFVQIPINIAVSFFSSKWTQMIIYDLRQKMGEIFLSSKKTLTDNGLFINTVTADCELIGNQLLSITLGSVPNIFLTIMYLSMLIYLSFKLTIALLIIIPLFVLTAYLSSKKIFKLSQQLKRYQDKLLGFLNGYIRNKLLIDLYHLKTEEQEKFINITSQVRGSNIKTNTLISFFNNITSLLTAVLTLSTLFLGSVMVIHKELSIGSLVAYNSYISLLFSPLGQLLNIPTLLAQIKVSTQRIKETQFFVQENNKGAFKEMNLLPPQQLSVKNLIPFIKETPLFRTGISFSINKGELFRVCGANGSGKSIFLKCLINYHDNFKGKISQQSGNNSLYIPQENFLFEGSIKDNMIKGIKSYNESELQYFIKLLKFDLPLEQDVTPFIMNLSSGQLQKIKLIRALLYHPDILLLDEIFSNIEDETIHSILNYIKRTNISTIFVYHGNFDDFLCEKEYQIINLNDFTIR